MKQDNTKKKFRVSFKDACPERVKCWDYDKNVLKPDQVGKADARKFWFICEKKHSFDMKPGNISYINRWCPYCSNKKVGFGNSMTDTHPEMARQWHPLKNKKSANQFTAGSNKKAWWLCEEGHEWEAVIRSRRLSRCPFCVNRSVGYGNSLADLHPELLKEINYDKSDIDPKQIHAGSEFSLWWICKRGHTWEAPVRRRTTEGRGCGQCSNQTSSPEIRMFTEFKALFPDSESRHKIERKEVDVFIPSLNIAIEYDGSYFHQNKKEADEQKAKIIEDYGVILIRLRENPLPCSKMDVQVPKERDHLAPSHILEALRLILIFQPSILNVVQTYGTNNEFIAEEEYRRIISYLPGPPLEDSLAEKKPEVSEEWNYKRNYPLIPELFHPNSGKKVWWVCAHDHEWEATIDKRFGNEKSKGRNCPYCSNKIVGYGNSLVEKFPEVAKWWFQPLNEGLTPSNVTFGSGGKHWFTCKNNHVRKRTIVDLTTGGRKCGHCPGPGRGRKYTPPKELDGIE
jgi:hypothetical protein